MKVLTLSRNYPNDLLPHLGLWVEGSVRASSALCEQRVVSPVPYAPPLPGLPDPIARYRRIPRQQRRHGIDVAYPRFLTGPGHSLHSVEAGAYYWSIRHRIDRLRHAYPFDLIHAHFVYPDGVAAARLGQRYGVPVLLTEHALWQPWMDDYPRVRRQAQWAVRHCTFQLAASTALRDSIAQVTGLPEKIRLVPIGMDPALFTPLPDPARRQRDQILFVGRIQPVKGVDVLIEAMRLLVDRRPATRLVLVGGGLYHEGTPYMQEVRALIRRLGLGAALTFAGRKTPCEVAAFMRESAVVVSPSRRESFGTVLVEALASGVPVVATRCGGPEDIVTDGLGRLVPSEDPVALAAALEDVLEHLDRYDPEHLAAHARRAYSWDRVARETVRLYEEALRRP